MSKTLNPAKILTELSNSKSNGKLQITSGSAHWSIYLDRGQLKCAATSVQSMMITLDYHLHLQGFSTAAAKARSIPASDLEVEHKGSNWLDKGRTIPCLKWLISRNYISPLEAEKIFVSLSREAIETCLWITEGKFSWIENQSLPEYALTSGVEVRNTDLVPLIQQFQNRLQAWHKLCSGICSPYQRLYLVDEKVVNKSSNSPLLKLAKFLKGLSFRQLALILKQDEIKVAQLLFPYVKSGEILLREPQMPFSQLPKIPVPLPEPPPKKKVASNLPKLKIACIDDSPTILDEMQRFLSGEIFEVTTISEPVKAAPILFRMKPDLILMDISMPNINGYKLCSLFRGSGSLRQTPIIMVSGRTGFIDQTRAKMVGATDYLTKPFSQEELLSVIGKHLPRAGQLILSA